MKTTTFYLNMFIAAATDGTIVKVAHNYSDIVEYLESIGYDWDCKGVDNVVSFWDHPTDGKIVVSEIPIIDVI